MGSNDGMRQYQSKHKVIEAVQFEPLSAHRFQLPRGVMGVPSPGADNWGYEGCEFWVVTIHGDKAPVVAGDWIIAERDGEHFYPCKPEEFEASYEPAVEAMRRE